MVWDMGFLFTFSAHIKRKVGPWNKADVTWQASFQDSSLGLLGFGLANNFIIFFACSTISVNCLFCEDVASNKKNKSTGLPACHSAVSPYAVNVMDGLKPTFACEEDDDLQESLDISSLDAETTLRIN